MRIAAINFQNFLSHRTFVQPIPTGTNMVLVAGPNGSGKTALQQGVMLAIYGTPQRGLQHKKEIEQLRSLGASTGLVSVGTDEGQFDYSLSNGKHVTPPTAINEMLAYTLDPDLFFMIDTALARGVVMKATGTKPTKDVITADLRALGNADDAIDVIDFKRGFQQAEKQANEEASEARSRWKFVTNEAYGAQKAANWQAPEPDPVDADIDEEMAARVLSDLQLQRDGAIETRGLLRGRAESAGRVDEAKRLVKREAEVNGDVASWEGKVAALEARVEQLTADATTKGGHVFNCPHCSEQIVIDSKNVVAKYVAPKGGSAARAAEELTEARPLLQEARAKLAELNATALAIAQAKVLMERTDKAPTEAEMKAADDAVAELLPKIAAAELALSRAQKYAADLAASEKRTEQAARAHAQVEAFTKLAADIKDLPGRYLGSALEQLNEHIAEITANAFAENGPEIRLDANMDMWFGPVRYGMASESQQWRMRLALAYAIAQCAGTGLLMIDKFDDVEPDQRGDILAFFEEDTGVQAVILGTTRKPYKPEAGGICIWLGEKQ